MLRVRSVGVIRPFGAHVLAKPVLRTSIGLATPRYSSNIASTESNSSTTSLSSDSTGCDVAKNSSSTIRIEVRVKQNQDQDKSTRSSSPIPERNVRKPKLSLQELNSYLEHNIGSYNHISSFSDLPLEFGYNQHLSIDNELRERLRALLWKFNAPIKYAFAYGSGVFSQGKASDDRKPQVDLIFGVSYTEHWHSLNMKQNPHHYSSLRWLGSGAVSFVQEKIGAGLYFNPYVEMDGLKIKYGVVNMDVMLRDLHEWDTLYLAGRLHKPVKILRDEPRVRFVNQANLISAIRTALLILPEEFSELDLYKTVAGISYLGDPRMTVGENPNKVNNIVNNQFLNFRNLYSSLLDVLPNVTLTNSSSFKLPGTEIPVAFMKQDMDPIRRGNMVFRLPNEFKQKLYSRFQSKYESFSQIQKSEDAGHRDSLQGSLFDQQIAADPKLAPEVSKAIQNTVAWPSLTQSAKGILTAGVGRSIRYATEKLQKSRL